MRIFLAFILWGLGCATVFGQINETSPGKKVTITRQFFDADGVIRTETIVKNNKAAEDFDLEAYIQSHKQTDAKLEITIQEGDDERTVTLEKRNASPLDRVYQMTERAFLGVQEDADEDPLAPGIQIDVVCGGAAQKAGLRNNDIILKLGGSPVNEWAELTRIIHNARPNDPIDIEYLRKGENLRAVALLSTRAQTRCSPEEMRRGFLGVMPHADSLAKAAPGVVVKVVENSAAAKAGLKSGDALINIGGSEISDWEDIEDIMRETKPGQQIAVSIRRQDGAISVLTPELGEEKPFEMSQWFDNSRWKNTEFGVRRKTACLGVYTSDSEETRGAVITDFTLKSSAKEAAMSVGDLITTVNDQVVQNANELWNIIAKYQAGDVVKVGFMRNNQALQIDVQLKACVDRSDKVVIFNRDEMGQMMRRNFSTWNWDANDAARLRERHVIVIRKGEGDGIQLRENAMPTLNPDRRLNLQSFKAYPNPNLGQFNVEFEGEAVPTVVSLYDAKGRQLFREELNAFSGSYFQKFDLREHAKGMIIIMVQQGDRIYSDQILVQ
ncbi:MAG: PDZ domain-containing protein [Saprospiraceae bacterium]